MRAGTGKARTVGAWLSLLALYVQVLLPMLVAVELRIAEVGGAAFALCHAGQASTGAYKGRATGAPGTGGNHYRDCCPLCVAASAGASYIAPAEFSVPLPTIWRRIFTRASSAIAVSFAAALTYDARAPPLNG